jgi:transposase-like protein
MSWNRSEKHIRIECPECGSDNVSVHDPDYEWRCHECESTGPEFGR